jgi:hypothetical protein
MEVKTMRKTMKKFRFSVSAPMSTKQLNSNPRLKKMRRQGLRIVGASLNVIVEATPKIRKGRSRRRQN